MNFNLKTDWKKIIEDERKKEYFKHLEYFVSQEYQNYNVYPNKNDIFRCFDFFNFEETSVVIIGQDPYHTKGMADGLAFSTKLNVIPKSLINILKELKADLGIDRYNSDLTDIAEQNVLLLNTCLTVRECEALSHRGKGWETFTDNIIKKIDKELDNVIFLLMGNNAISKSSLIINNKDNIITTSHPSPFSYKISFQGSRVFSRINDLLLSMNKKPIIW